MEAVGAGSSQRVVQSHVSIPQSESKEMTVQLTPAESEDWRVVMSRRKRREVFAKEASERHPVQVALAGKKRSRDAIRSSVQCENCLRFPILPVNVIIGSPVNVVKERVMWLPTARSLVLWRVRFGREGGEPDLGGLIRKQVRP